MPFIITDPCIETKDTACVDVCPVDCIHPRKDEAEFAAATMLYIHPEECIDCEACVPECPVEAIFHESNVPRPWTQFIQLNAERAAALKQSGGHITERQEPRLGPGCRDPRRS